MSTIERAVEAHGDDVDQAIQNGLAELGVDRSQVTIEVLDEGSSGFLGIGSRPALVRLLLAEPSGDAETAEEIRPSVRVPADQAIAPEEAEEQREEDVALETVRNLLERMQVQAEISLDYTEPDELTGEQRPLIEIRGENMGVLIGPRGESLNALQFVARLMTGHALHRRPTFIVDIEGYRRRREQALARLAERMAAKALKRGRPMSLEPMPANERRIIHMTLRNHDRVYTESTGEGKWRKVRILLK